MAWNNWHFSRLNKSAGLGTTGYKGLEDTEDAFRLLLVDDEWCGSESKVRQYCEKFLSLQHNIPPVDSNQPVWVFFTDDFDYQAELLKEPSEYDFDGILQDLMRGINRSALPGEKNLIELRQSVKAPRPGVLVVTQHSEKTLNRTKAGLPHRFGILKDAERTPEHDHQIREFFRYVGFRYYMRTTPIKEELQKFVGVSTLYRLTEFLHRVELDQPDKRLPVVILGATGTGKEHVARLVHEVDRARGEKLGNANRFVPILFSAIGENVMDGEIFGIENLQGSPRVTGYIREAANGTVFFDELADIPKSIQGKLLRFLEEHQVHPIGGQWEHVKDVRTVFATNDENALSDPKCFREDFIHRIDGLTFRLPDLAKRKDEHQLLIDHFLLESGMCDRTGKNLHETITPELNEDLLDLCQSGGFTGNVRQLKIFLERLARFASKDCPVGKHEYEQAMGASLCQPGINKQASEQTDSNSHSETKITADELENPLDLLLDGIGWNEFIQLDRWHKGRIMKMSDDIGFAPREVVGRLMSNQRAAQGDNTVFVNGLNKPIQESSEEAVLARLLSTYERSKKAWVDFYKQSNNAPAEEE